MKAETKESFYRAVGKCLTREMKRRNISIGRIVEDSGEQHATIYNLQNGKACHMHHLLWLYKVLGITAEGIIAEMESKVETERSSSEKAVISIDDLI